MIKILVTGAGGQLGSELNVLSSEYKEYEFTFADKKSLDLSDEIKIENYFEKSNFDVVINCGAYTNVDKAEDDEVLANKVNHLAVKLLAQACIKYSIKLMHISTDYVFDGKNYKPYLEDDITSPCNLYGKTKLLGEEAVIELSPKDSIIIRTSWVYSSFGNNFVKTMLRLGEQKDYLNVVYDQIGTPTYARDLARVILDILPSLDNENVEIYNYSNEGVLSWYDFAKEIMDISKRSCEIFSIGTIEYPTPAVRPYYSLLNKSKIKNTFNIDIPYWKDSLEACLITMREKH